MSNTENSRASRFRAIETILLWEGEVDNSRLRALLGVQSVQASRVLAEFAERNAGRVLRRTPRSPYQAASNMEPLYSSGRIEEYLGLLRRSENVGDLVEDARVDLALPSPRIFSTVLKACRRGWGLQIEYRSMSNPEGQARLIYPHTVVRAGRRWHARAWCADREDFRDFVIGRMGAASLNQVSTPNPKRHDVAWNKKLPLILGAHPALSARQRSVIRNEYLLGAASYRLMVRSCLLFYVIQDLRAAVNPLEEKPPQFQLIVTNARQLRPHLLQDAV
jgi:hypothetical protein